MKYNELQITANKPAKRVGRGIAAGSGKTAGRGTKGQKSRTGSSKKPGFEGGQNPLIQRLPKLRGFKSHRTPIETISIAKLTKLKAGVVDTQVLAEQGIVSNPFVRVKLIGNTVPAKKFEVKVQLASKGAIKSLEKAGGSFTRVVQLSRSSQKETK
jgi:large subunit ribosomal protein L15